MSMICEKCGKEMPDGSRFCTECGAEVKQTYNLSCNYFPESAETVAEPAPEEPELEAEAADGVTEEAGGPAGDSAESLQEQARAWQEEMARLAAAYVQMREEAAKKPYVEDKGIKQRFFRYENRLNRKRYFIRSLQLTLLVAIAMRIVTLIDQGKNEMLSMVGAGILLAVVGASMVSMICLNTRRLHDLGRSGIIGVLVVIPYFNILLYLYLFFFKGTEGPNLYGPDPLETKTKS